MKKSVVIIIHILYWFMYALFIFLALMLMSMGNQNPHFSAYRLLVNPISFAFLIPGLSAFYLYYCFVFPVLSGRRLWRLAIFCLLFACFAGIFSVVAERMSFPRLNWIPETYFEITVTLSIIGLLNGWMALAMRGFIQWYGDLRLKEDLRNKNLQMELALLRAQVSPHF